MNVATPADPACDTPLWETESADRIKFWKDELRELAETRDLQALQAAIDVQLGLADLKIKENPGGLRVVNGGAADRLGDATHNGGVSNRHIQAVNVFVKQRMALSKLCIALACTIAPVFAQAADSTFNKQQLGVQPPARVTEAGIYDKTGRKVTATKLSKNLFDLEDRAIIIVGGKQTTAGEVKKAVATEITKKAGPPRIVNGGARKLDLAALNVTSHAASAQPAGQNTMERQMKSRAMKSSAVSPSSPRAANIAPSKSFRESVSNNSANSISASKCLDKGPPIVSEVQGRLKPGGKVTVWGRCFGDRPGRVEIIGQFPGGKLVPPFTAWDMTGIEIEIPANIRGATDHVVAVTVVTADGKITPAMQAQFVAARERIEVPERLWSPSARFELSSTSENSNNKAYSGQISKTLRVNPQCGLDTMDAIVLSGGISQIRGWEQGPPNEAYVTIDWVGTCTSTTTRTSYNYVIAFAGDDISISSACRVAFQARAWAYCPAGIAP